MINREDIIRMAREADREWDCDRDMVEWLEWFAALIAARVAAKASAAAVEREREECAKVCADLHIEGEDDTGLAADIIRARGNA